VKRRKYPSGWKRGKKNKRVGLLHEADRKGYKDNPLLGEESRATRKNTGQGFQTKRNSSMADKAPREKKYRNWFR